MAEHTALQVLSKHGKSFRFAGLFLPKQQLTEAARLYQFCRWIDDIADEATDKQMARERLVFIKRNLVSRQSDCAMLNDFLALKQQLNIPCELPLALIDGVISDLGRVAVRDHRELLRYAYRVAGVVGLMMCPVLQADQRGYAHAVDLGIAMQLTNIARDVMEDAQNHRRYLPATWCDASAADIVADNKETRSKVKFAISKTLELAEQYYRSGAEGYRFLPADTRKGIAVAAAVYRHIGVQLANKDFAYWRGREVVSLPKKVLVAFGAMKKLNQQTEDAADAHHSATLHQVLEDLLPISKAQ